MAYTRTEHNGAKRGRGFWGQKKEAKLVSKKKRREESRSICRKGVR